MNQVSKLRFGKDFTEPYIIVDGRKITLTLEEQLAVMPTNPKGTRQLKELLLKALVRKSQHD